MARRAAAADRDLAVELPRRARTRVVRDRDAVAGELEVAAPGAGARPAAALRQRRAAAAAAAVAAARLAAAAVAAAAARLAAAAARLAAAAAALAARLAGRRDVGPVRVRLLLLIVVVIFFFDDAAPLPRLLQLVIVPTIVRVIRRLVDVVVARRVRL